MHAETIRAPIKNYGVVLLKHHQLVETGGLQVVVFLRNFFGWREEGEINYRCSVDLKRLRRGQIAKNIHLQDHSERHHVMDELKRLVLFHKRSVTGAETLVYF